MKNLCLVFLLILATLGCQTFNRLTSRQQNNAARSNSANPDAHPDSADNQTGATNTSQGLCANAYYPVGEQVERKYHIVYQANALPPKDYTQIFTDISADKFVERNKFDAVQNAINFQCTADGLQGLQFDNGNSVSASNMRGKLETVKSEGISFPAEKRWRTGEKWSGNYVVHFDMQMGGNASGAADATISGDSEIIGEESVTVPAGSFQAFKVKTTTTFRYTSVKANGKSIPMNQILSMDTTAWYAKDVGMVKSVMTGMMGGATTELVSNAVR